MASNNLSAAEGLAVLDLLKTVLLDVGWTELPILGRLQLELSSSFGWIYGVGIW